MFVRALFFAAVLAMAAPATRATCPGNATYRFSNVCEWTSRTHPTDYPENAHFSPMCGTAHNGDYEMFRLGGFSTDGVREVAETGNCSILEGEIDTCMTEGGCLPDGYFSYMCDTGVPDMPMSGDCSHSGMFMVTPTYPYMSAISMIAPSPDWFVGLSSVNLCVQDETTGEFFWIERYPPDSQQNLYSYDAGTDAGTTFLSEDAPLDPFINITIFDAMDATNIFYNQVESVLYPVCRVMLEKM